VSAHITQITVADEPLTVTVTYSYHRAYRGQRDSLSGIPGAGPPLEPDEPEHIEIESIRDEAGNGVEVSKDTERQIERDILAALFDAQESAAEARYEAREDDRRERERERARGALYDNEP
jgi:hypothetical protein